MRIIKIQIANFSEFTLRWSIRTLDDNVVFEEEVSDGELSANLRELAIDKKSVFKVVVENRDDEDNPHFGASGYLVAEENLLDEWEFPTIYGKMAYCMDSERTAILTCLDLERL